MRPREGERKSQRSRENGRQECVAKPGQREPGVLETDAAKEATEGKGRICPLLNLTGAERALLGGPYLGGGYEEGLLRRDALRHKRACLGRILAALWTRAQEGSVERAGGGP